LTFSPIDDEPSMTDKPTPPAGNGFSDSDQQWFDRLSGKPVVVKSARAIREADALNLALRLDQEALDADPEVIDAVSDTARQQQWEQLQFRLQREGLRQSPAKPWWRRWSAAAGLAAALVLASALVPTWRGDTDPNYGDPPTLRGDVPLHRVRASQPRQAAEAFTAALRAAGLKPGIYRRNETFVVDVGLEPDQLAAAAPAFEGLSLKPTRGLTRVEFE
jgi:hypothetical protein